MYTARCVSHIQDAASSVITWQPGMQTGASVLIPAAGNITSWKRKDRVNTILFLKMIRELYNEFRRSRLIRYIPEIIDTGVDSIKIEGRMKSLHYTATVTSVYRQALDLYYQDPENYQFDENWLEELRKASHRRYISGFFLNPPGPEEQNYRTSAYQRDYDFMGIVRDYLPARAEAVVEVRHKFVKGDKLEITGPGITPLKQNWIILSRKMVKWLKVLLMPGN